MDLLKFIYGLLIFHACFLVILLLIHLITGKIHLKKEILPAIVLIPIGGLLLFLAIEWVYLRKQEASQLVELEEMSLGNDIYWKTLKKSDEDSDYLVPLEEALNINDYGTRRKLMLDIMLDDPKKYLNILTMARLNDDSETTHYATAMLTKLQQKFQGEIQRLSSTHYKQPDNQEILDEYLNMIEQYLKSGLLEDSLQHNQRVMFAKMIEEKLSYKPNDVDNIIRKIRNSLDLKDFITALEASKKLQQLRPNEESTWIESMRVNVEAHDLLGMRETLTEIKSRSVYWSKEGTARIKIWESLLEKEI